MQATGRRALPRANGDPTTGLRRRESHPHEASAPMTSVHILPVSLILSLALLCACGKTSVVNPGSPETPKSRPTPRSAIVPGEVLVKFRSQVPKERIAVVVAEMGAEVIRSYEGLRLYHLRIVSGEPLEVVIRKFSLLPEVEFAEPNYTRKSLDGGR